MNLSMLALVIVYFEKKNDATTYNKRREKEVIYMNKMKGIQSEYQNYSPTLLCSYAGFFTIL